MDTHRVSASSPVTAAADLTPEPVGHTGEGLWRQKGLMLPAYIQHIANDLIEGGMAESRAIATAVSRVKVWCATSKDAGVKAKACAAASEWEALKADHGNGKHAAAFAAVEAAVPDGVVVAFNPNHMPAGSPKGGQFAPGGGGGGGKRPTPTNQNPVGNGESSQRVKDLQMRLNALGIKGANGQPLKVDGIFGPQTLAAVQQFQRTHKDATGQALKVDGLVGPKTTGALRMKTPVKHSGHHTSPHKTTHHKSQSQHHHSVTTRKRQAQTTKRRQKKQAAPKTTTKTTSKTTSRKTGTPTFARLQALEQKAQQGKPLTPAERRQLHQAHLAHEAHLAHLHAAVPQLVTIPDVDLMAAGTWDLSTGPITFTAKDMTDAVEAAKCPAVGDPVIKLGHIDPRFDGQPAIGRVRNMRMAGPKLKGDLAGMPGWLAEIAHAAFPRRSVEGQYNFKCQIGHKHPFVLTGLALLGVTAPGVGVLNDLQDIASLYGVTASAGGDTVEFASDHLDEEGPVVAVTEEDVRRAYYASGVDHSWWITEMQMDPTQLIVSAGDGQVYRVPFSVSTDGVEFGDAEPLDGYADIAAARGTGRTITYASAEDSRDVGDDWDDEDDDVAAASNGGWVMRDGEWEYDPDGDGDDDSNPEDDTDHSHWDENGKQLKPIPPNPEGKGGKPMAAGKPYGDVEYADPGYLDADGNPAKDGNGVKRYPIDAEHVEAAWSYINQDKNAKQYTADQLASIKGRIKAAMSKHGHQVTDTKASSQAAGEPEDPTKKDDGSLEYLGHPPTGSKTNPVTHTHPVVAGGEPVEHTHAGGNRHSQSMKNASAKGAAGKRKGDSEVEFTDDQVTSLRESLGLGEDDDLTADRLVAASADLKKTADQKVAASNRKGLPPGVIAVEEGVWKGLQDEVEAGKKFRAKVARDERDEVIGKAVREGKFSAARADHWRRLWDADPEGTREVLATLRKNTVPVSDMGFAGGAIDEEYDDEFAALYPAGQYKKG